MDWTQSVPLRRRGKARKTNRAHQGEDEHHTTGRPGTGWFPPADMGPCVTTAESDKSTDTQSDIRVLASRRDGHTSRWMCRQR